jgi:4-hydroxybenzoate polyprenyltransferase
MTTPATVHASARPAPLIRAAHIGPAVAVTLVVALLAVADGKAAAVAATVTTAVLAGQLTIGWGNDLVDAGRDRQVARADKPLANDELTRRLVLSCLLVAASACVALSFLAGWRSALVHLCVGVVCGHAYNLGMKATAWSWLPYALAFGTLPAVVTLAGASPHWPPSWMLTTAAALGIAAHLLNALPDLADDAATGVRGLPHRLGATASRVLATVLLVAGSGVAVLGPAGSPDAAMLLALGIVVGLAVLALVGRGKAPFYAAIAIALVDVVLLVVAAS